MSFFKKAIKFIHPGARQFLGNKGDGGQGYMNLGQNQAENASLGQAMTDYNNIEPTIRNKYIDAAKKAGTYSDTGEFQNGLNSEVQAGVRGARVDAVGRINALRKQMGNNEEFKPDDFAATQGNATADKLAAAPPPEDSPASVPPPEATGFSPANTANAATGVQNTPSTPARPGVMNKLQPGAKPPVGRLGALRRY